LHEAKIFDEQFDREKCFKFNLNGILYLRCGSAEILMVCVVSLGRVTTRSCTLSQAELQEKLIIQMQANLVTG
jgi:hypothetical protein